MASRKDEKERLRVAREQAEAEDRKQERKRLILGYVVAGVITLAVVVGIVAAIAGGGEGGETVDAGSNERLNTTFGSVPKDDHRRRPRQRRGAHAKAPPISRRPSPLPAAS